MSKYLGKYDVAGPAQPWYDRANLTNAIEDGRTKVEEWSYEKDPHYYCHERPDLALLVEAADRVQQQDEQLRELLSYCKTQDRVAEYTEAYADVAYKLAAILDGEQ